jgi:hypothetical protein
VFSTICLLGIASVGAPEAVGSPLRCVRCRSVKFWFNKANVFPEMSTWSSSIEMILKATERSSVILITPYQSVRFFRTMA